MKNTDRLRAIKLLRLCGSPNDHEALLALRKLQAFVGGWNEFVDLLTGKAPPPPPPTTKPYPKRTAATEESSSKSETPPRHSRPAKKLRSSPLTRRTPLKPSPFKQRAKKERT